MTDGTLVTPSTINNTSTSTLHRFFTSKIDEYHQEMYIISDRFPERLIPLSSPSEHS